MDKRNEISLSQADITIDFCISESYLARIETDSQSPRVKTLSEIAEVLEIPTEKIIRYAEKTRPFVSPLNRAKDYDEQWMKLSLEMKNMLLESVEFLEQYL